MSPVPRTVPRIAAVVLLALPGGLALAAESRIETVTLYPGAIGEVERRVSLEAGEGEATVRLPPALVDDSVQVRPIEGSAPVAALEVASRRVDPERSQRRTSLERELERTERELGAVEREHARLERSRDYHQGVLELPRTSGEAYIESLAGDGGVDWPQTIRDALAGLERSNRALGDLAERRERLGERRARLEDELAALDGRSAPADHVLTLERGARDEPGEYRLSYRVREVGWENHYRAALDSASGEVALTHQASVRQDTGEDWDGVVLAYRTERPHTGALSPTLPTRWVDFAPEEDKREMAAMGGAQSLSSADASAPAAERERGRFADTYRLREPASVESGAGAARLTVAEHALASDLRAYILPEQRRAAHLKAAVTAGEALRLPEGLLSRYRDGGYVGEARLEAWGPGESRVLDFGPIDSIEVAYEARERERSEPSTFTRSVNESRAFEVRVANHGEQPIAIELRHRIPRSRHESIEVRLDERTPEPATRTADGVEGLYAWRWTAEPDEEREWLIGFGVSFPEGEEIRGLGGGGVPPLPGPR